jgi:hypothetical protein
LLSSNFLFDKTEKSEKYESRRHIHSFII